jgi:hypothetical protein
MILRELDGKQTSGNAGSPYAAQQKVTFGPSIVLH